MKRVLKACVIVLGFFALNPTWCLAQTNVDANLYRVRRIFLETEVSNAKKEDLSNAGFMREALTACGFVIVNNPSEADAVFSGGETFGWIVFDGPQLDPPKYGFLFSLVSTKYNLKWETEVDLRTRADKTERGRKAIDKAVNKLFSAWKRSAKHAGLVVGDKIS